MKTLALLTLATIVLSGCTGMFVHEDEMGNPVGPTYWTFDNFGQTVVVTMVPKKFSETHDVSITSAAGPGNVMLGSGAAIGAAVILADGIENSGDTINQSADSSSHSKSKSRASANANATNNNGNQPRGGGCG